MKTAAMELVGLTSEGCIDRIMGALSNLAGVQEVVVSLLRSRVTVQFDETRTALAQIDRALSDAGYIAG